MNAGVKYTVANGLDDSPRSFRGEFFEILGPPTTTHYSEVFWAPQPVDLPESIVQRFDGKVMAVTGYEVDIVRTSKDGKTTTSVPAWEIYNHYEITGTEGAIFNFEDLMAVELKGDNLQ